MPFVAAALAAVGTAIGGAVTAGAALLGSTALAGGIGGVVFTAFKQIALGVALSALSRAIMPKPDAPSVGGQPSRGTKLRMTTGEDVPQSFVMGTFATAGDLLYVGSWGEVDDTPNAYLVRVIELGDWPARLKRLWIDGAWERLGTNRTDKYGLSPVPAFRRDGKDHMWVKFFNGTQEEPSDYLLDKFGDPNEGGGGGGGGGGGSDDEPETSKIGDRFVIAQNTEPAGAADRLWLDTGENHRPRIWSGGAWQQPPGLTRSPADIEGDLWWFDEPYKGGTRVVSVYAGSAAPALMKEIDNVFVFYDTDVDRGYVYQRGTWVVAGSTVNDPDDPDDTGGGGGGVGTGGDRPWKADMIGRGMPCVIETFLFEPEVFPDGVPDTRYEMEAWGWYDRRKDSTAGGHGPQRAGNWRTWKPTTNPIVFVENILRGINDPITGAHVWGGQGVRDSDLPRGKWFAAANLCDESGGDRYRASLEVRVDEEPAAIIEELLKACAGTVAEVGGRWLVEAGEAAPSVFSFTDADVVITEPETFDPFPGLDSAFNEVRASYPAPGLGYDSKDSPPLVKPGLVADDGGKRNVANISFLAVPYPDQVERLKSSAIKEGRRFRRHAPIVLPPNFRELSPLDVVTWSSETYGYDGKKWFVDLVEDLANGCVALSLREVDPTDYDPDYVEPEPEPDRRRPRRKEKTPDVQYEGIEIKGNDGTGRRPGIRATWKRRSGVESIRFQVRTRDDHDHVPVQAGAMQKHGETSGKELTAGGRKMTMGGDRQRFDAVVPIERGKAILQGGGLLADERYDVRSKYQPGKDWSPWIQVRTPNVRIPKRDLSIEVQDELTAASVPSDGKANIVPDDNLQLQSYWGDASGGWQIIPQSNHATADSIGELRWTRPGRESGPTIRASRLFKVTPHDRLAWRFQTARTGAGSSARVHFRIAYFAKDGSAMSPVTLASVTLTDGELQTRSGVIVEVPAGAYQAVVRFVVDRDEVSSGVEVVKFFSPRVSVRNVTTVEAHAKATGNLNLADGAGYTDVLTVDMAKAEGEPVDILTRAMVTSGGSFLTWRMRAGSTDVWEDTTLQAYWYENEATIGDVTYRLQAKAVGGAAQIGPRVLSVKQHIT